MKTLLACLLFILAVPCQGQSPSGADDASPAIDRLREGLITSFNQGDVDGLLRFLAPEVVVTWQNGEVCHGPGEVRAFYQRMMSGDQRIVRELKSNPEVLGRHVYADWAVSWGNLHDHFVLNDGSDLPFNSLFTATIAKHGDQWLVVAFHTSVSAFENPVLTVTKRKLGWGAGIGGTVLGLALGAVAGRWIFGRKQTV